MQKKPVYLSIILGLAVLGGLYLFLWYAGGQMAEQTRPEEQPKGIHYSYFSQKDFYEQAYAAAENLPVRSTLNARPYGLIVNHHLLASSYIAEALDGVATDVPITVLLVSPNHFDAGKANVITSQYAWQTPYGILQPDLDTIDSLAKDGAVAVEEQPFEQEHGVSGIVGFVKKSLPNARLVPVIFKNRMTLEQSLQAAEKIKSRLPGSVLVVGSFDFSHYLPSLAADFHDLENLAAVEALDTSSVYRLDIDSRPGLAFYLELMKGLGAQKFVQLEHSNSAKLTKQDVLETTSYITGYSMSGQGTAVRSDTLLALGTVLPSDSVLKASQRLDKSYALTYLERLLYGQDQTIAFSTATASPLRRMGVELTVEKNFSYRLGGQTIHIVDCRQAGPDDVHKAIDGGAGAVVCQGAKHNHVEIYKGKPVVYAAGNFLDDELVKSGGTSMAVGLASGGDTLSIYLFPIRSRDRQLKLLVDKENATVLAEMANRSQVSPSIKKLIESGLVVLGQNSN